MTTRAIITIEDRREFSVEVQLPCKVEEAERLDEDGSINLADMAYNALSEMPAEERPSCIDTKHFEVVSVEATTKASGA